MHREPIGPMLLVLIFMYFPNVAHSAILVPTEGNRFFAHICNTDSVSGTLTEFRFGKEHRAETLQPGQCFSEEYEKLNIGASEVNFVFKSPESSKLFEYVADSEEKINFENLLYFFVGLIGVAAKDIFIALASPIVRRVRLGRRTRSFRDRFAQDLKNATVSIEFDEELLNFKSGQYDAVAWGGPLLKSIAELQDLYSRVVSGKTSNVEALGELGVPV